MNAPAATTSTRTVGPDSARLTTPGLRPAPKGATVISAVLVLGLVGFCYADVFRTLWLQWNTNEANSHGFLIPWLSAYVVWLRRDDLRSLRFDAVWWAGVPALVLSLGILLIGRLVDVVGLQEGALILSLWALVVLFFGWHGLRELWFPVGYLLFMMPVWDVATEQMYYPLQSFAATGATALLRVVGVPVFREGTVLTTPNTSVQVGLACSGINFLMAVVAIGLLLAYALVRGTARRLSLIIGAIAVALFSNPLRVALITFSFHTGISNPRQGHMWQGMAVSIAGFALLFAFARWLDGRPRPITPSPDVMSAATKPRRESWLAASLPAFVACLLLLVGGFMRPLSWPALSLERLNLDSLPYEVGEWTAVPGDRPSNPPAGIVQPDEFWREYRDPRGRTIRLYIGRFGHTVNGEREIRYWSDLFANSVPAQVRTASTIALRANHAVVFRRKEPTPVLYWYQTGARATTDRVIAKLHAAWCAVTRRGTGPIAVVIFGDSGDGSSDTNSMLAAFAGDFLTKARNRRLKQGPQ